MFGRGAPRCRRCNGAVYSAEEVIGAGSKWHNECFSCKACKTRLSSTTLSEKDGEIYCNGCYAKNFGPKGFGIGGTSVQTGVSVVDAPGTKTSANQFGGYAGAPAAAARSPAASPNSGNSSGGGFCCGVKREGRFCGECGKPGDAAAASSPAPVAAAASPTKNWNTGIVRPPAFNAPSAAGAGERCGKCHERVYDAEKVVGGGKSWHSACFRCQDCRTGLSSTTLNDKDGGIYCGACYAKRFGPKGFGFSGGSASTFAYTK